MFKLSDTQGDENKNKVAALPSVRSTTLEADPIHVLFARNTVAFTGMVQTCDAGTGHSKHLLPKPAK